MRILTAAEMAATDRRTADLGTPSSALMENAGAAVARFCLARYRRARRIVVLCGRGNNGGDGFIAARHLALAGREVHVLFLGSAQQLDTLQSGPAHALARLLRETAAVTLHETPDEQALRQFAPLLGSADLLLDAIVGTGFHPPLRGLAAAARDLVAPLPIAVVAVDLPSGWDADSTAQDAPDAFRADAVVTFTAPKSAHVFGYLARPHPGSPQPGAWPFGPVVVAEIGSPRQAIEESLSPEANLHWTGSARPVSDTPRPVNSNKGKFGHVLVVAGSRGTAGAPSMSSLGALRTGAGLVTAAVPRSIADTVALAAVELMLAPLDEDAEGSAAIAGLDALDDLIREKRITTLAIGPGLSTRGQAGDFARQLVARTTLPTVLDADALNAFAGKADLLKQAAAPRDGKPRILVLTPHPGEMARLAGLTVPQVESDRVGIARRFATGHGVTVVLKGWRTLVAQPDGRVAINTTGNPAMAKGGSGDILTGIVAAMLAQYGGPPGGSGSPDDVARAVEAAVYLHGLAGDLAARRMDQHTVLATDTLHHLSAAFRQPARDPNGLTWIAGLPRCLQRRRGSAFG